MNEQGRARSDWVIPAVLVGAAAVLLLIWLAVSSLAGVGDDDPPQIVLSLDDYTRCLADHGANVPRVEARDDGGFAVIVPGSFLDDGADFDRWRPAHDACAGEARALFGDALSMVGEHLFESIPGGSLTDLLGVLEGVPLDELGAGAFGPWDSGGFTHPPIVGDVPPVVFPPGRSGREVPVSPELLEQLCDQVADGSQSLDRQTLLRLERRCEELGT